VSKVPKVPFLTLPDQVHSLSVYKFSSSVMPDLIRHPEIFPTRVGDYLKTESRFPPKTWIPAFAGMTALGEGQFIYRQW